MPIHVGLLRVLERALALGGLTALAWSVFAITDAWMAQRQAMAALHTPTPLARAIGGAVEPAARIERRAIPHGSPLAILEIPRLRLVEAVLEGSDGDVLRHGPGHIEETSLPGQIGNVGIAGHRDTFFRPLRKIRVGDIIRLTAGGATTRYRVSSLAIVRPSDAQVLDATLQPTVTLITCYPFGFVGQAPLRYVVRAVRVAPDRSGRPPRAVSS